LFSVPDDQADLRARYWLVFCIFLFFTFFEVPDDQADLRARYWLVYFYIFIFLLFSGYQMIGQICARATGGSFLIFFKSPGTSEDQADLITSYYLFSK